MNKVLITTTNSFEEKRIERYIKVVSTNVVVVTNYDKTFKENAVKLSK